MAVPQSGTSATGDARRLARRSGLNGIWLVLTIMAASMAAGLIAFGVFTARYQPLRPWQTVPSLPGLVQPDGARVVDAAGGRSGQLFIPPQEAPFEIAVSLANSGPYPVDIEAVSLVPPGNGEVSPLSSSAPAVYWTSGMVGSVLQRNGRPVAGLTLKPGEQRGIYVAVPVLTSRCYLPRAFQVVSSFYVQERFLFFSKWVRIPLTQPLMVNAYSGPVSPPGTDVVCAGRS